MDTVEDLGRAMKTKYPGEYDEYSDWDVGQAVKTKYPGAYDNYPDVHQAQELFAPPPGPEPPEMMSSHGPPPEMQPSHLPATMENAPLPGGERSVVSDRPLAHHRAGGPLPMPPELSSEEPLLHLLPKDASQEELEAAMSAMGPLRGPASMVATRTVEGLTTPLSIGQLVAGTISAPYGWALAGEQGFNAATEQVPRMIRSALKGDTMGAVQAGSEAAVSGLMAVPGIIHAGRQIMRSTPKALWAPGDEGDPVTWSEEGSRLPGRLDAVRQDVSPDATVADSLLQAGFERTPDGDWVRTVRGEQQIIDKTAADELLRREAAKKAGETDTTEVPREGENVQGIPGEERVRQEPVQAEPDVSAGRPEAGDGGVVQDASEARQKALNREMAGMGLSPQRLSPLKEEARAAIEEAIAEGEAPTLIGRAREREWRRLQEDVEAGRVPDMTPEQLEAMVEERAQKMARQLWNQKKRPLPVPEETITKPGVESWTPTETVEKAAPRPTSESPTTPVEGASVPEVAGGWLDKAPPAKSVGAAAAGGTMDTPSLKSRLLTRAREAFPTLAAKWEGRTEVGEPIFASVLDRVKRTITQQGMPMHERESPEATRLYRASTRSHTQARQQIYFIQEALGKILKMAPEDAWDVFTKAKAWLRLGGLRKRYRVWAAIVQQLAAERPATKGDAHSRLNVIVKLSEIAAIAARRAQKGSDEFYHSRKIPEGSWQRLAIDLEKAEREAANGNPTRALRLLPGAFARLEQNVAKIDFPRVEEFLATPEAHQAEALWREAFVESNKEFYSEIEHPAWMDPRYFIPDERFNDYASYSPLVPENYVEKVLTHNPHGTSVQKPQMARAYSAQKPAVGATNLSTGQASGYGNETGVVIASQAAFRRNALINAALTTDEKIGLMKTVVSDKNVPPRMMFRGKEYETSWAPVSFRRTYVKPDGTKYTVDRSVVYGPKFAMDEIKPFLELKARGDELTRVHDKLTAWSLLWISDEIANVQGYGNAAFVFRPPGKLDADSIGERLLGAVIVLTSPARILPKQVGIGTFLRPIPVIGNRLAELPGVRAFNVPVPSPHSVLMDVLLMQKKWDLNASENAKFTKALLMDGSGRVDWGKYADEELTQRLNRGLEQLPGEEDLNAVSTRMGFDRGYKELWGLRPKLAKLTNELDMRARLRLLKYAYEKDPDILKPERTADRVELYRVFGDYCQEAQGEMIRKLKDTLNPFAIARTRNTRAQMATINPLRPFSSKLDTMEKAVALYTGVTYVMAVGIVAFKIKHGRYPQPGEDSLEDVLGPAAKPGNESLKRGYEASGLRAYMAQDMNQLYVDLANRWILNWVNSPHTNIAAGIFGYSPWMQRDKKRNRTGLRRNVPEWMSPWEAGGMSLLGAHAFTSWIPDVYVGEMTRLHKQEKAAEQAYKQSPEGKMQQRQRRQEKAAQRRLGQ